MTRQEIVTEHTDERTATYSFAVHGFGPMLDAMGKGFTPAKVYVRYWRPGAATELDPWQVRGNVYGQLVRWDGSEGKRRHGLHFSFDPEVDHVAEFMDAWPKWLIDILEKYHPNRGGPEVDPNGSYL